jgi:hypothetical protein
LNSFPQVIHEVHPRTSLKAGGGDKQPNCRSLCGGHKDDPADMDHPVTDRVIAEDPG